MRIEGVKLSPRQKEIAECFVNSNHSIIVVCTGRQVGKSLLCGQLALNEVINKPNCKVGFFLPTYKQAKEHFKRISTGIKAANIADLNGTDLEIKITHNNSIIKFWTSENDNCRGFTYDTIIVDEACFIKDEIFAAAILPTVAISLSNKTGKILLTSTPKEKNWFYDYFNQGMVDNDVVKSFIFTSEEGGLYSKEVLDNIRKMTPEPIFKNEYLAQFIESGNGLFNYNNAIDFDTNKLIIKDNRTNVGYYYMSPREENVRYVAGLDIATENDYTVLTIIEELTGKVVLIKRWNGIEWYIVMNEILPLVKTYNAKLFVEVNGVGAVPYQNLHKLYSNTHKWVTSQTSKIEIIQTLIRDIAINAITIPNLEPLLNELDNYGVEYHNNKPSYNAIKGNDDMVMSLAIANYNRYKNTSRVLIPKTR